MLFILFLICAVNSYLELKLIRRAIKYIPDEDFVEIVTTTQPGDCPEETLNMIHNATYVSQICFRKDVFYNVEVILGNERTTKNVFEMFIDLTSPWTWYKSNQCVICKNDPYVYDFSDNCDKSGKSKCFNKNFNKSFNATKWNDIDSKGQIYSDTMLLSGKFQTDTIQLLAYNSSEGMSVVDYLKFKIEAQLPTELQPIKNVEMLQVEEMSKSKILADGSIGLGFGFVETEEESNQKDSDFVEQLINQRTDLKLTRQQFAIYSFQEGDILTDFVIQLGGFDYKYAHMHSQNILWINKLEHSAYYWMVQVDKILFKDFNENYNAKNHEEAIPPINKAILTLNSQFIELPKPILDKLIVKLENMHSKTKCSLKGEGHQILYCQHLQYPQHFINFLLSFQFPTLDKIEQVDMSSYHLLLQSCTNNTVNGYDQDCYFNLKVSRSNYIILGEPFMKQHYVIFENQPGNNVSRIGILPSAGDMIYIDKSEWPLMRLVVYVFIFGIVTVCCVSNLKRALKDIYRAIKYRRAPTTSSDDQKNLRSKASDMENIDFEVTTQEEIESKKQEQWEKEQAEFNFGQKFEQQVEDHSI